jgi:hypothetical protein
MGDKTIKEILEEEIDTSVLSEELDFIDDIPDQSMIKSSIIGMDHMYINNMYTKDLAQILTSFSKQGLFLSDYAEEEQIDELNRIKLVKAKYEDIKGTSHTINFKIPIVDEDGVFMINGIKNRMKKQFVNTPICKISDIRVSLASNYNKTLVERNIAKAHNYYNFISNYIERVNKDNEIIRIKHGINAYTRDLPYEYTSLGKYYTNLTFGPYILNFNFDNRFELASKKNQSIVEELESKYGVYFGNNDKSTEALFIGNDNILRVINLINQDVVKVSSITELMFEVTDQPTPIVSEWVNLKILDKNLPIIFILAYRYGLTDTLKYLKLDYQTYPSGTRVEKTNNDIVIKFRDKSIVFNRYPLIKSLIVSGLLRFNTKDMDYELFDDKDVYYELLISKGYSTNYIKGIDDFFDLFVDPITRDILVQMKEPTNVRDLLIRSTEMLTTEYHKDPSSMANHRVRSYERFNSVLYNEMSRQFAAYRNQRGSTLKFSINPEAVLQRIIQDQSVVIVSEINPVQDIKDKSGFTYTGMGGRTAQSFVVTDRKYSADSVGIISESTPDSGKVAITAYATMNPKIKNLRGLFDVDKQSLEPTEVLSATALLMPGSTNDDQLIEC